MPLRGRVETGFRGWGRLVVRGRWLAIAACAGLTAVLAWRLPDLRVDNSDEAFLQPDDLARILYDEFREQYGRDDDLLVILHPGRVFDLAFLETLRDLHRDIEREVPTPSRTTSASS